jgi:hypothetical protein
VTFADFGAAAVAVVLALVPAAIVLLGLNAATGALRLEERLGRGGYRAVAAVIGTGTGVAFLGLTWAFAGANYLKPRCLAFGDPEYATAFEEPAEPVRSDGLVLDAGSPPPAWAARLIGPGRFAFYAIAAADGRPATRTPAAAAGTARAILRVRRSSARPNLWLRLGNDRFEVFDTVTRTRLARGNELWVDAGPVRYRCGIASGPAPVRSRDYPPGDGVFAFVRGAVLPPGAAGTD